MRDIGCVLCLLCLPLLAFAQPPSAAAGAVSAGSLKAPLQFQSDAFSVRDYEFEADQEFVFKKEPAYAGRKVMRSAFPGGVGYAIDVKARKLYVDANGNMDLTDDPKDVYTTTNEFTLEFENVRLPRKKGPGQEPVVLDLNFFDPASFSHTFKSGWSGTVKLGEKDFNIALPDSFAEEDFGRSMYITPAGHKEPFTSRVGPRGFLAIGEHVYALSVEVADSNAAVVFREIAEKTGEVFVDAYAVEVTQSISEYEEQDETTSIVFPDKKFRLPFGAYGVSTIFLRGDRALFSSSPFPRPRFNVGAAATTVSLGPPLRETVAAKRVANRLEFSYRLEGKGKEEYSCVQDAGEKADVMPFRLTENAPMLTVKQDDRVVLSDHFKTSYG